MMKEALADYMAGVRQELPEEVASSRETHPGRDLCPFFSKVASCRFGNQCSRNHVTPGVSKVLLIPSLYTHFSLYYHQEYDTDVSLEYDNKETYKHFLEFYDDVVEELRRFGRLRQVKVCRNGGGHLRGHVYVEYTELRAALAAYMALQGRFYAGKRINIYFVTVPSWKQAICGLQWSGKCSKGSMCNFLHVFNNPGKEFRAADYDQTDLLEDTHSGSSKLSPSSQRDEKRSSRSNQNGGRRRKRSWSRDDRSGSRSSRRTRSGSRSSRRPRSASRSSRRPRSRSRSRSRNRSSVKADKRKRVRRKRMAQMRREAVERKEEAPSWDSSGDEQPTLSSLNPSQPSLHQVEDLV